MGNDSDVIQELLKSIIKLLHHHENYPWTIQRVAELMVRGNKLSQKELQAMKKCLSVVSSIDYFKENNKKQLNIFSPSFSPMDTSE